MPRVRSRVLLASALAAGLAASSIAWSSATAAPGATNASGLARNVIVLLRDQHTNLAVGRSMSSARVLAAQRDQAPLVASAKKMGARNVRGFTLVNGFAANMTPAQMSSLASNPAVAAIVPDRPIARPTTDTAPPTAGASGATTDTSTICPSDPSKPLLEPEALQTTHTAFLDKSTPQAQNIVDGSGVKVAWIADGIDINNPDFIRPDGSHVIVDYQDFSGDGLDAVTGGGESFGDASSIAAQGRQSYDLANFVNPAHPLPAGCTITVRGVAPGASLVGLKVFGNAPTAPESRFIEAIDYAVNVAQVDVLNESFGANPFPDFAMDPIALADDAAVAAGVTVVSGTGDAGTNGTFQSPGTDPNVISVAGTTTLRLYQQTGFEGANLDNGTWANDNITSLSGGGTSQQGRVPDLAAPGDSGWALCTPDVTLYAECTDFKGAPSPIEDFGGTSESAPLVSGGAALVIEAYEKTHHGARPSPALVKQFLTGTATDLGYPAYEQGAGELNTLAAVQAAQGWRDGNGKPASTSDAIIPGPTQLTGIGQGGSTVSESLSLTNTSSHAQTVKLGTRTLGAFLTRQSGAVTLNAATAPSFLDFNGAPRAFVRKTFTVPKGADRLDVSFAAPTPISPIRVNLIDPRGRFQAYSVPQGNGNFGHVDVRLPMAGTWSAYFVLATTSGFNGPVQFAISTQKFGTAGSVTPSSVTIPAHGSRTVTVSTKLSKSVGDVSAAVQVTRSGGAAVSVPLTLRTVIPTSKQRNTFTGIVTGGNGRNVPVFGIGQSNVYYLDVPAGRRDMTLGLTLDNDPGDIIEGVLTDPNGQVASFQSNVNFDNAGNPTQSNGFQLYRRDPIPGRWIFSLLVIDPITGLAVSQGFHASVAFNTVKVTASLPNSASTVLAAGHPVNVPVRVTNTGAVPLTYFADGRLASTGDIPLAELSGTTQPIELPVAPGIVPIWQVPTDVTSLRAAAVATTGVNLDFFYSSGNPDVYAADVNNSATVNVSAPRVSQGVWGADVGQTGPFNGPAPSGSFTIAAVAHGQLFDPAVRSTTGDVWAAGVDPGADPAIASLLRQGRATVAKINVGTHVSTSTPAVGDVAAPTATGPVTLFPGQSTTITITITPAGAPHSVVRGHLYIDTFGFLTGSGDELIDLPYTYTVG
ncbi:MAG TPA: S8 family serine peptidase [Micromonosporaceae bacterium]|nr:S8 family serine peptidase [Micromonosporaceae bacterium]